MILRTAFHVVMKFFHLEQQEIKTSYIWQTLFLMIASLKAVIHKSVKIVSYH